MSRRCWRPMRWSGKGGSHGIRHTSYTHTHTKCERERETHTHTHRETDQIKWLPHCKEGAGGVWQEMVSGAARRSYSPLVKDNVFPITYRAAFHYMRALRRLAI